jgi:deoxyribodipyrimidine photo-lyase
MKSKVNLFWFRRDLRLIDNAGLFHALRSEFPVVPVFVFDRSILDRLEDPDDARVTFIHREVEKIKSLLIQSGSDLWVHYGTPQAALEIWSDMFDIQGVFTNHDYEPYAIDRDREIAKQLAAQGAKMFTFKDQVIFEKDEILKDNGTPYTVFTPYANKWRANLNASFLKSYPSENYFNKFYKTADYSSLKPLQEMGFTESEIHFPESVLSTPVLVSYKEKRDFPAIAGTSRLSVHLRFGTVSIRKLASEAYRSGASTWLNELIWRDFYQMILWHFPHVVGNSFKPDYDRIEWLNNQDHFQAWCRGMTGYPIVDAGMRELRNTGFMHNRVRMIVASFLTKHLLIDWRWGEAWFARYLLDFELASNNGGWQWAASSGCDAAPYFRVFNPALQTEKFDPHLEYVKKWVPELNTLSYPKPIVDHKMARQRAVDVYKKALSGK